MPLTHEAAIKEIERIVERYGTSPEREHNDKSGNNWYCFCPLHEKAKQGNPSLRLYVKEHGAAFSVGALCGSCPQERQSEVRALLKADGFLKEASNRPINLVINRPPHADPPWESMKGITDHWEYKDLEGVVQFWLARSDIETHGKVSKKKQKRFSRIYSVHDKQDPTKNSHEWSNLTTKAITPYNAFILKHRPDLPILIVEGPKTCDAAQEIYGEHYTAICGESASNLDQFDWSCCQNRVVRLYPDNDMTSINAFTSLGRKLTLLGALDVKIAFLEVQSDYPQGWDLADEIPEDATVHPDTILENAVFLPEAPAKDKNIVSSEQAKKILAQYDTYIAAIASPKGNFDYFDIRHSFEYSQTGIPFPNYDEKHLLDIFPEKEFVGKKEVSVMETWLAQPKNNLYHGIDYAPGQPQVTTRGHHKAFNIFIGFKHKPRDERNGLADQYVEHLNMLTGDRMATEYILDFFAHMVQQPLIKPNVALVLIGQQGSGKSLAIKPIIEMLGRTNAVVVGGEQLARDFNPHWATKLVVNFDEAPQELFSTHYPKIRHLITAQDILINAKNRPEYNVPSYHRVIITMNRDVKLTLSQDDRRFSLIRCDSKGLHRNKSGVIWDEAYFKEKIKLFTDPEFLTDLHLYLKQRKLERNVFQPYVSSGERDNFKFDEPVTNWLYEVLYNCSLSSDIVERDICIGRKTGENACLLVDWPGQPRRIPKKEIADSVRRLARNKDITNKYITKMLKLFGFHDDGPKIEVFSNATAGMSKKNEGLDYAWNFDDPRLHRKRFEEVTEKSDIEWPPYTGDPHLSVVKADVEPF